MLETVFLRVEQLATLDQIAAIRFDSMKTLIIFV